MAITGRNFSLTLKAAGQLRGIRLKPALTNACHRDV
jgi:hypothetical protein